MVVSWGGGRGGEEGKGGLKGLFEIRGKREGGEEEEE